MVLHAEDDHIIPIDLGKKLVDSAVSADRKVKFVKFAGDREFLHKFIHRAHELPSVVRWGFSKNKIIKMFFALIIQLFFFFLELS